MADGSSSPSRFFLDGSVVWFGVVWLIRQGRYDIHLRRIRTPAYLIPLMLFSAVCRFRGCVESHLTNPRLLIQAHRLMRETPVLQQYLIYLLGRQLMYLISFQTVYLFLSSSYTHTLSQSIKLFRIPITP